MQRYNVFLQIHKGLRAMLYQTAEDLQQTDFTNSYETDRILGQVLEVVELFDQHTHTEGSFILAAIEKHRSVTPVFGQEHIRDRELSCRIRALINMFKHSFSTVEQVVIASAIRFAFVEFLVFHLNHMAKEENVLNNLLWESYTDEELRGISHQIVAQQHLQDNAKYSRWMMLGLNNPEIISWLKDVRNNAPEFVFRNLLYIAENELSSERWLVVRDGLTDAAMVA